jgi:hypothetical protein
MRLGAALAIHAMIRERDYLNDREQRINEQEERIAKLEKIIRDREAAKDLVMQHYNMMEHD